MKNHSMSSKFTRKKIQLSVAKCYKDARSSFTAKMTENEKMSFLTEIPSFHTCNGNFYKFRNHFIPKSPETSADFETLSE